MRVGFLDERRDRSLQEVLIHPERFIELSERLFEPMRDRLSVALIEALVVNADEPIDQAEGAGLRQKRVFVDEAPQREQTREAAGRLVVLQNAAQGQHAALVFAASYRPRLRPARKRICSICGSCAILHRANPYSTPNTRQPARKL